MALPAAGRADGGRLRPDRPRPDITGARREGQGKGKATGTTETRMADAHAKHHDYHLVDPSPWPVTAAISALFTAFGFIIWMRSMGGRRPLRRQGPGVFAIGVAGLIATAFMWWRDVIIEANKGDHTPVVQLHLRYGMILFIASEVMFFVAWFWAYFDASLFPADVHTIGDSAKEVVGMVQRNALFGGQWPPVPVEIDGSDAAGHRRADAGMVQGDVRSLGHPARQHADPALVGLHGDLGAPCLLKNDRRGLVLGLVLTVILGMIFTALQAFEYHHAAFSYGGHIVRLDVLHGDGLPRRARHHRHDLPARVPVPGHGAATSRRSSTSASRRRPGTGTSSTWCGCSCSPASTSGARAPMPARPTERARTVDLDGACPATGRAPSPCLSARSELRHGPGP